MKRTKKIIGLFVLFTIMSIGSVFASPGTVLGTIVDGANVRSTPSTEYAPIGYLSAYQDIQLIECNDDWYTVNYNGSIAYVYAELITNERFANQPSQAIFATDFSPYAYNRDFNIRKAAKNFDGLVVYPGQTISFNEVNGNASFANGYKSAPVQVDGEVVPGEGGGVCQVSTTLYNAVRLAGLEIVERHNHGLPVSYVDFGYDATIAYGYLDFKFRNNKSYPIVIRTFGGYGKLIIGIEA